MREQIAIHFAESDTLQYVQRDVPVVHQPVQSGLDVLLTTDTREPIGWCIYGWSRIAPTTPDAAHQADTDLKEGASGASLPAGSQATAAVCHAEPTGPGVTITRAEARRLVNYAHKASSANWTPFIRENGVGGESPWAEFLRIADRLWVVLFPDHDIRQIDPRLPAETATALPSTSAETSPAEREIWSCPSCGWRQPADWPRICGRYGEPCPGPNREGQS